MAWPENPRPAKSLVALRDQLNKLYPGRNKASDGMIGNEAHQARVSDHNPDENGIVKAFDITPDPDKGLNLQDLADDLIQDVRTNYVIYNRRIWQNGVWSKYAGTDPHTDHLHLSVKASNGDQTTPWDIGGSMDKATQIAEIRLNHLKSIAKAAGISTSLNEAEIAKQVSAKLQSLQGSLDKVTSIATVRENFLKNIAKAEGLDENLPADQIVAHVASGGLSKEQIVNYLLSNLK